MVGTFLFVFLSFFASAETPKIKKSHLEFVAVGKPAMIKIVGESNEVTGSLTSDSNGSFSGTLSLNIKSLKTGIEMRDEHMKEKYLEVEKYPTAYLKVQRLPAPAAGKSLKNTFSWPLSLHGIEKNVDVTVDMKNSAEGYSGDAEFSLKLSDYNIAIPTYLGVKVADKVEIKVNFEGAH